MSTIRENLVTRKIEHNKRLKEAKKSVKKVPFSFCMRGDWETAITGISEFFSKGHPKSVSKDNLPDNWVNNNVPSQKTAELCKNISLSKTVTPYDPEKAAEIVVKAENTENTENTPNIPTLLAQKTYS